METPVKNPREKPTFHGLKIISEVPRMEPLFDVTRFDLSSSSSCKSYISSSKSKTQSDSKLSFGPMKALHRSMTQSFKRKRLPSKLDFRVEGSSLKSVENASGVVVRHNIPSSFAALHGTMKTELRRQVSKKVLRHKLNKLQDYSLAVPEDLIKSVSNIKITHSKLNGKENKASEICELKWSKLNESPETCQRPDSVEQLTSADKEECNDFVMNGHLNGTEDADLLEPLEDTDLQQKIDHEIKMREGTTKLLAASKHPNQLLEAARSLLCSNTRIIAYMTELQRRKTQEVLGQSQSTEGNQLPCRAQVSVSDIRIPLMWKDTDHFKNKGDYRQYAVFCLLKIGTEIFDTSMITNVDRSMTDISFEDVVLFRDIPHDFELKLEVYCHKLHEELSMANTPKKIKKKITDISGSVGRSVGKRLSGLNDADVIGSMVLGPRFELVAKGTLQLQDVHDSVRTFDFQLEKNADGKVHELPLFGNYCCRVAAVPGCLVKPAVAGYLNVQEDDDLFKWRRYWCVLKNLRLACWLSPTDIEVTQPLFSIPVTKSTQISDADPSTCKRAHTFLIKTVSLQDISQHTLAADSKEELNKWWDGFQQHLLDQALWKHACDEVMSIRAPTKSKVPFYRKSSIYEDTPLIDPDAVSDSIVSDLKVDDAQLSQMLTTLMGEASQIRGSPTHGGASS